MDGCMDGRVYCYNQFNRFIVEDEYHKILICPKYIVLREEYLNTRYQFGDGKIDF